MSAEGLHRILLTGDTEGGVWTFVLELAEGLIQRGFEVFLITFGRSVSGPQKQAASAIPGLQWFHHKSKLEWMQEPWGDIQRAASLLREIAQPWHPDLVHLNTLCHGDLSWNVPVLITHHSCVVSWWRAVKRFPLSEDWRPYRQEVARSLQCATAISAPSNSALLDIRRDYAIKTAEIRAIYNGRNSDLFRCGEKQDIILSAGRLWDEGKNVSALAELASRIPWPVFLAGDSNNPAAVGVAFSGCHFLGKLSTAELSEWYAKAAIYVLPTRYEPFGLSILEAALSGCALVLGDIPSLREIWGDAALFVPVEGDALERALHLLISDSNLRTRMSHRAFHRARQFTQSRMVDGYIALYHDARAKYYSEIGSRVCAS